MYKKTRLCWSMLLCMMLLASCGVVFEDGEICPNDVVYRLRLDDSRNMNYADAFSSEVQSVALFVFDSDNGKFVWKTTETVPSVLHSGNYSIVLPLEPGNYDFVAWCGIGLPESSFRTVSLPKSDSLLTKEMLDVVMNYDQTGDVQSGHVHHSSLTQLHNGVLSSSLLAGRDTTLVLPLTRDVNNVQIVMQRSDGTSLDKEDFEFSIEGDNGRLSYDNRLVADGVIHYQPFDTRNINSSLGGTSVLSELSVARLVTDSAIRLKVKYKGSPIINIPFISFALMTKGFYHEQMDDQEYLDREDKWNFIFFLDENNQWEQGNFYINDWHVVVNNPTDV